MCERQSALIPKTMSDKERKKLTHGWLLYPDCEYYLSVVECSGELYLFDTMLTLIDDVSDGQEQKYPETSIAHYNNVITFINSIKQMSNFKYWETFNGPIRMLVFWLHR